MTSVTTYTRDFFYFIKKQSEFVIKEDVKHNLIQIEKIIKIINNNDQILVGSSNLNWRKPKSLIDKEKLSKDELLMIEITGLLNKLSPKNFDKINEKIIISCDENKDNNNIVEKIIDDIFLKAVMQSTYCPYYVKLINNIINIKKNTLDVVTNKCNEYIEMFEIENKTSSDNITQEEKETYDEFCEKVKQKKFKAGYSQFIGELFNNKLIHEEIIKKCVELFLSNIISIIEFGEDELVEDNIICIFNIIKTTLNKIDYKDLKENIIEIKNNNKLIKRMRFKLMDLYDLIN